MIIGGLQKFSLCDYPGYAAAVVFTRGCNFRCRFCHNGNLISKGPVPATDIPEPRVIEFLTRRRGQLQGVVICGGEPTLQTDLLHFLKQLRLLDYRIKLDTNGSHPVMIQSALESDLVDYIAMDVKATWEKYDRICAATVNLESIRESIALIAGGGKPCEFRTTWVKSLLSETDIQDIQKQLPAGTNHRVQAFQSQNALDPTLQK